MCVRVRFRLLGIAVCLMAISSGAAVRMRLRATENSSDVEPRFRVTLLGTGNPRPSIDRFGPCTLIEAGKVRLLVDSGRGASIRLFQIGSSDLLARIDAVLLTHLHSDHVVGLPDLWLTGWIFGRQAPLAVYGPAGTSAMMDHLRQAFSFDITTRRDLDERYAAGGIEVKVTEVSAGVVLERDGAKVTAFSVDHGPVAPAYGYRIDFAGHSVVVSGDTRPSDSLILAAKGTDVLIHEVLSPEVERRLSKVADPEETARIIAHHCTPEEAGRVFTRVGPKLAVYNHIVPSPAQPDDLIPPTRKTYQGRLAVGYDLMLLTIGADVEISRHPTISER
ncbi:MAG TPA: MBL fold metallo-hydrolase [Acidobacteriota bacterium]|nr:MBL fold metallo-hydrolase [Acidobacteriota bacterium]